MLSISITLIEPSDNYNLGSHTREEIAHVQIVNRLDHPHRPHSGNYRYIITEPDGAITEGRIENFPRHRGALRLLAIVLDDGGLGIDA